MRDFTESERVIEELWHNLFRMHSYIEVEMGAIGDERPGVLKNADKLLAASHARVVSVLPDTRRLEDLPDCCKNFGGRKD